MVPRVNLKIVCRLELTKETVWPFYVLLVLAEEKEGQASDETDHVCDRYNVRHSECERVRI